MRDVTCDECGESFRIQKKEKKHGKGIREQYFTCPHCKKHYTAFVTDAECREAQRKIRQLRANMTDPAAELNAGKIDVDEYTDRIDKIYTKIDKQKSFLENRMSELKQKVSS